MNTPSSADVTLHSSPPIRAPFTGVPFGSSRQSGVTRWEAKTSRGRSIAIVEPSTPAIFAWARTYSFAPSSPSVACQICGWRP